MVYAVIDTNVLVSAIFAAHPDSATVIVRDKIMDGTRLSLGPRTHRARQPDKSARPALHLIENEYICSLIE